MKGKVEQQEMELNVSNPRIFMEVQTASKEEVSRLEVGHLKVCQHIVKFLKL